MAGSAQNGHTLPKSDLSRHFKRKDKQSHQPVPPIALRGHFCLPHQPPGNHVQVKDKISTRDTSALGQAQHQRNPQVDPKLARNPAQLHRRTHRALPAKPRLLDYAPRYLLHISQTLLSRRPQQCHPRRTPVRLFHPHPLRYQLHRYPTSLPRRHRHCHPHPQPHARRKYPFRRQSPLLRLSSLHPPDQRIRHLQATPTSRPTQLLSHHRQPRLVLRFQAIRKPCQRPRPPPHTDIMSHFYSPKSPDPVLFSLGNERSHVYAYLPTFSITTLTSRKNSKSPKRAVWTDFRHLGFTHD